MWIGMNLGKLVVEIPETIYRPQRFPGLVIHIEQPEKASILLFSSGKIVITGLKDKDQINPVVKKIQELISIDK